MIKQEDVRRVVKGYVGWVITILLTVLYAVWCFVPDSLLQHHFVLLRYFMPNKYWAMAIPAAMCCIYMTLYMVNTFWVHYHNHALDSFHVMQDMHTVYLSPGCIRRRSEMAEMENDGRIRPQIPLMKDIPIHEYCRVMYKVG